MPYSTDVAWIHDCRLLSVAYEHTAAQVVVKLLCECPADLGYEAWSGRRISIAAGNVAMVRHLAFGAVGIETISTIRNGISSELQRSVEVVQGRGVMLPDIRVTVCCSSGASIELICETLTVEALD